MEAEAQVSLITISHTLLGGKILTLAAAWNRAIGSGWRKGKNIAWGFFLFSKKLSPLRLEQVFVPFTEFIDLFFKGSSS